jgi:hypothetical protein
LKHAGVPATVEDYGPGTHSWPYWQRDLHHALPLLMAALSHPAPSPASWSYRTTDRAFDVWGYHVAQQGGSPGWIILSGVWRGGLSARGTGRLVVTTAPLYRPHGSYTVTGPTRQRVQADAAGRLRLILVPGGQAAVHWTIRGPS